MQPQRAETPAKSDEKKPPSRVFCLDCAREVDESDAAHLHHVRVSSKTSAEDTSSRIQSVAIDLVGGGGITYDRISTGVRGFDEVLGGGLVRNGIVVIDGPPGIGKTTLLASAAGNIASRGGNVLYASGEETAEQVAACAWRIGHAVDGVRVLHTQSIDTVLKEVRLLEAEGWKTDVLIVDSAQAMRVAGNTAPTGSPWMVGAVGNELRFHAKAAARSVVLVSQVNKEGQMAGPKTLEHAVDTVLDFGRDEHDTRFLRTTKNRFGIVGAVSRFEMGARGLREVDDPALIAWRDLVGDPGVCGCISAHLAKPCLVAVEALVSSDDEKSGGRSIQATGVPVDRVRFVLESLSRHAQVSFANTTVRVRVPEVAGSTVDDSGLDLAIAAACYSSLTQKSVGSLVAWGSVGLSGKVQSVSKVDTRVAYAEKVGVGALIVGNPKNRPPRSRIAVEALAHISDFVTVINSLTSRFQHDRQASSVRRPEVRSEARSDARSEARGEARPEVRPEALGGGRLEARSDARPEAHHAVHEERGEDPF